MSSPEETSRALAALAQMPRTELAACWEAAFKHPVPPRAHSSLLRCALAWDLQMKASGWTPARIGKMFKQATGGDAVVQPGTRLVREWQGQLHQVTVLPSGYDYEGTFYSSLTAISRKITGISWSGPRFFGLKS